MGVCIPTRKGGPEIYESPLCLFCPTYCHVIGGRIDVKAKDDKVNVNQLGLGFYKLLFKVFIC